MYINLKNATELGASQYLIAYLKKVQTLELSYHWSLIDNYFVGNGVTGSHSICTHGFGSKIATELNQLTKQYYSPPKDITISEISLMGGARSVLCLNKYGKTDTLSQVSHQFVDTLNLQISSHTVANQPDYWGIIYDSTTEQYITAPYWEHYLGFGYYIDLKDQKAYLYDLESITDYQMSDFLDLYKSKDEADLFLHIINIAFNQGASLIKDRIKSLLA